VFICGDEALGDANKLRSLLAAAGPRAAKLSQEEIAAWMAVHQLAQLLESCRSGPPTKA
jgi:hypothetical protein